jgi:hypothetical protein
MNDKEMDMKEYLTPEDEAILKEELAEEIRRRLIQLGIEEPDHDESGRSIEELMRSMAYHEAAHAVIYVMHGKTIRDVFITTEYGGCVTDLDHLNIPGDPVPLPWQALGRTVAVLAGDIAMHKQAGQVYPWRSWGELVERSEELERSGDSDDLENDDITKVRRYCKIAAGFGMWMKMSLPAELPEGMPPLQLPPSTPEEAFEQALSAAEQRVDVCWPAIEDVAERLVEVGHLTGEEVEEIVMNSGMLEEAD